MKGTLLTYLLQFFSGVIIVVVILMSSTIVSYHIFQKNWINSKLQAEVLSSIISSLSSSSFDYKLKIYVGNSCNIRVSSSNITCTIGEESYTIKPIIPNYVELVESTSLCNDGFLEIVKIGDRIWLE